MFFGFFRKIVPRTVPTLAALTAVLLSACSSIAPAPPAPAPMEPQAGTDAKRRADFDRSQDRWHGAKVLELVAKLGQPTAKVHQQDGRQVYVYSKTAQLSGPIGPVKFVCVVRYTLDDKAERVSGHTIEGC